MNISGYILLDERGLLAVEGEERIAFLQGLISNDADRLAPDQALHAALLTAQGKYLHDFFLTTDGTSVHIDCEAARAADLLRRLSIYKLRAKATLRDVSADWRVYAAFGEDALARLGLNSPGLDKPAGWARAFAGGVAYGDPRHGELGARIVLPAADGAKALDDAGLAPADREAYEHRRLTLGVPDGSRDLRIEQSLLLESGFDELNGIDWHKGCYVGQELTARTKYRALIRKRLIPVRIDGPAPPAHTPIQRGDVEVGDMRSSSAGMGLALLRLDKINDGDDLPLTSGEARLTPQKPAWARF